MNNKFKIGTFLIATICIIFAVYIEYNGKYKIEHKPINSNSSVYKYTKIKQIENMLNENHDLIVDTIKQLWKESNETDEIASLFEFDIWLFDIDGYLEQPERITAPLVKNHCIELREIYNKTNMEFIRIDKEVKHIFLFQECVSNFDITLLVDFDVNKNWKYRIYNYTEVDSVIVKTYDFIFNKHLFIFNKHFSKFNKLYKNIGEKY